MFIATSVLLLLVIVYLLIIAPRQRERAPEPDVHDTVGRTEQNDHINQTS